MRLAETVTNKVTQRRFETLEEDFNKIHSNKYDYTNTVICGGKTKIKIICPIHGEFEQRQDQHLSGKGCRLCGLVQMGAKQSKDKSRKLQDSFVSTANKVHQNKYDYSKVVFSNREDKVVIICPIHGDFEQVVHNHLSGRGCRKCASKVIGDSQINASWEKFIQNAPIVHNNKYVYDRDKFVAMNKPMHLTCPIHGSFKQIAANHLSGSECPKCALETVANNKISKSKKALPGLVASKFGSHYTLKMDTYTGMVKQMKAVCNIHNVEVAVLPTSLVRGRHACPYCSQINNQCLQTSRPTCVYYIKILHEKYGEVFKIGITSKPLTRRFTKEDFKDRFSVMYQSEYLDRCTAVTAEQQILLEEKESLLNPDEEIVSKGEGEIFKEDIYKTVLKYTSMLPVLSEIDGNKD